MIRIEPATLPWLDALVEGDATFSERFGVPVIEGWAGFPEAVPFARDAVRDDPDQTWGSHLFFDTDGALVGFGGWKGPPVDGEAELGYAIAGPRQGRGLATEAVRELVARGRAAGLRTAVAHTLASESPSTGVLRRCGFVRTAVVEDPEDGPIWRWELAV